MKDTKFIFDTTADKFSSILSNYEPEALLMPAERNGLHLLFRELSTTRTTLLHHASKKDVDLSELLRDVIQSPYSMPIASYIDWLNGISENNGIPLHFEWLASAIEKLLGGVYKIDKQTGCIEFKSHQIEHNSNKTEYVSFHNTSSAVNSLMGLWFYLKYQAGIGYTLMIEEPEMNLHPQNQRKIARILARLVNEGIKVVISTHSDYIIREFNTLIMLDEDKDGIFQEKHGYLGNEILNRDSVGAYLFDAQTINRVDISRDDGIYANTFDTVIKNMNKVNNDIYYSLQETK